MAARRYASYSVELLGYHSRNEEPLIITLYTERLSSERQSWWYSRFAPAVSEEDSSLSAPTGLNEPLNTR